MTFTKRLLRTSDITETATGFAYDEFWRVESTEVVPLHEAYAWFRGDGQGPRPGRTMVAYGGLPVLCDQVRGAGIKKARKLFDFVVSWKSPTPDKDNQSPITSPSPFGATESPSSPIDPADPDTWEITIARRPQLIQRQVADAYYIEGYVNEAHAYVNRDQEERSPIVNSAIVPLLNLPEGAVIRAQWEFRRVSRVEFIEQLAGYENSINETPVELDHRGLSYTFAPRTLWLQTASLNETTVNGEHAWETVVTCAENRDGWDWLLADVGNVRRAWPGDKDAAGNVISRSDPVEVGWIPIVDELGRPVSEPIPLDGNGAPLPPESPLVYGRWSDFKAKDLNLAPVISLVIADP